MTLPEVLLWQELRKERFKGWRFRRQMPVGPFIADFGCPERKLLVEVDGAVHDIEDVVRSDERRSAYLRAHGFRIYRVAARDVLADLGAVLDGLELFLGEQG